jgi:hypothetical protein
VKTLDAYEAFLTDLVNRGDLTALKSEALERMRLNLGLLVENADLRQRIERLEGAR